MQAGLALDAVSDAVVGGLIARRCEVNTAIPVETDDFVGLASEARKLGGYNHDRAPRPALLQRICELLHEFLVEIGLRLIEDD